MSIEADLTRIADALEAQAATGRMIFRIGAVSEQSEPVASTPQFQKTFKAGDVLAMAELTATQKATASVLFRDKKGNIAKTDGTPTWGVDNPNVLAITPSADGLSCDIAAVGPLGTALVSVQADADLGAGVQPIAGTLSIDVVSGAASVVDVELGPASEQ